jgi:imidazolonepropionase-like amidohydrolase
LPGLIDAHTHLVTDSGNSALDRVAGYSVEQIDEVITRAVREQLSAGVTTVRDLGDRRFCVVQRRDTQLATRASEPTIVASGPPLTSTAGHCHFLGGEVSGTAEIIQAIAVGVDGIEHCSCVTDRGVGQVSDDTLAALARSQIAVCPTIGVDPRLMKEPPPALKAMVNRMGVTPQQLLQDRRDFVGRLHRAGVRLVSGVDSGIGPAKRHGTLPYAVCELVTAGFSVAEALATATSAAALACGVGASKGRLAAGLHADLLVVESELETDITALLRPQTVLLQGVPVTV